MSKRYRHTRNNADTDSDDSDDETTIKVGSSDGKPKDVNVVGNTVYFYCDVTVGTVLALQMTMARLVPRLRGQGVESVNLYIASDGGDVYAALAAYDALRHLDIWLTTVMTGSCCSAATLIAMAGQTRAITSHAHALLHQQRVTFCGLHSHLSDEYANQRLLTDQMVDIYTVAGCAPKPIRAMLADEAVTTPDQALALGLVTEIW